jgi:hypothetical protein
MKVRLRIAVSRQLQQSLQACSYSGGIQECYPGLLAAHESLLDG